MKQKQVFTTKEIPHLWMHKTQQSARNKLGNLYYEGETIYSYGSHFPIAKHITNERGENAVLVTTRSYSVTTAKQIHLVKCAIPSDVQRFNVEFLSGFDSKPDTHIRDYKNEIEKLSNGCLKARSQASYVFACLKDAIQELNNYYLFFNVQERFLLPNLKELEKHVATQAQKAEQGRKKKLDKEIAMLGVKLPDIIEAWRKHEQAPKETSFSVLYKTKEAFTRLSKDAQSVETSKGASVPLEHAKKAVEFIKALVQRGEVKTGLKENYSINDAREFLYKKNGHTFHIGHYPLDIVLPNGDSQVGCHFFKYEEILNLETLIK